MTEAAHVGISAQQVQLLVSEAQLVVRQIEQLPDHASDSCDRDWCEFQAHGARQQWQELLSVLRDSRAEYFTSKVRAIIANSVPLAEAPPELTRFVDAILQLDNELAGNYRKIIDPLISGRRLIPEVYDQLREILPRLAPEFDA
jgi:hypothetical protein